MMLRTLYLEPLEDRALPADFGLYAFESDLFTTIATGMATITVGFVPGRIATVAAFLAPESPALAFHRQPEVRVTIGHHVRPLIDPLAIEPPIKRPSQELDVALLGVPILKPVTTQTASQSEETWEPTPVAEDAAPTSTKSTAPLPTPELPQSAAIEAATVIPETLVERLAARVDVEGWAETATQLLDSLEAITPEPEAQESLWWRVGYWAISVGAVGLAIEVTRQGLRARSLQPELPQLPAKR